MGNVDAGCAGEQTLTKIIALIYRKAGVSREQFLSYWMNTHGPLMLQMAPGLLHYTQNVPMTTADNPEEPDGVAELWFEDMDALEEYLTWRNTTDAAELRTDEDLFQDSRLTRRYVVEEHVFKRPAPTNLPG